MTTTFTTEFSESEQPALQLFQHLDYQILNASQLANERPSIKDTILRPRLEAAIKRINPWINENNLNIALRKLIPIETPDSSEILKLNQAFHKLISGPNLSLTQSIDGRETTRSIHLIDYHNIANNDFLVVNQMSFKGRENNSKPDLVVYINGLPIAIIECKSPKALDAAKNGIEDLLYYQENSPQLFLYNQICAAIYQVGGKYGALNAPELHYNVYRTEDPTSIAQLTSRPATPQDILIYHLFKKEYLLDIIRNFILFQITEGKLIKILPRYQQIRAVNKIIKKLKTQEKGGVIWHTQGSGKSLSMVYLATKLRRDELGFNNPTIIVMTDRIELDNQITKTFRNCNFPNPIQAASIQKLHEHLQDSYGKTIMTTIHKFQENGESGDPGETGGLGKTVDIEKIPPLSSAKNIFVFVDEAHRTQYGFLAAFMRRALPNAKFIAFTGTPIAKENKSTLAEFYGGNYLDVYPIKQSVADNATLPIYYDSALPHLHIDKDLIDQQLAEDFSDSSEAKREKIRQKAARIDTIMHATPRIREITGHILKHYTEKVFPNGLKAMIVCHSREAAAAYAYELDSLIPESGFHFKTHLIISLDIKKDSEKLKQLATSPTDINKTIERFKYPFPPFISSSTSAHAPNIAPTPKTRIHSQKYDDAGILIVCDMLLTGYDAPIVQVMYLDKLLKEHNLLQAIARVNRTRENKTAGYIIDYCGITGRLTQALEMYAEDLTPQDIMETPNDEYARLQLRHNQLVAFFQNNKSDRRTQRAAYVDQCVHYLEPENFRDEFKQLLARFNISIDILLPAAEALAYKYDFDLYNEIKLRAANLYVDNSLRLTKSESLKIKELVDKHLHSQGIQYLLDAPVSIIDQAKFNAEIAACFSTTTGQLKRIHRIKHIIQTSMDKNPEFYKPLWKRLQELLDMVKTNRIQQLSLFTELENIEKTIVEKHLKAAQLGFTNEAQFAVYKTLENEPGLENYAQTITHTIFQSLAEFLTFTDWMNKENLKKTMRLKIKETLEDKISRPELNRLAGTILETIRANILPGENY